jgi:hypothetical protein
MAAPRATPIVSRTRWASFPEVKRFLGACVLLVAALPRCSVYSEDLLDDVVSVGTGGIPLGSGGATGGVPGVVGGSGGAPSGGLGGDTTGGSGGSSGTGNDPILVDEFVAEGTSGYNSGKFYGGWYRYADASAALAWEVATEDEMVQVRPDQAGNFALHVKGSGFMAWGVDIACTLKESAGTATAVDLSGYDGIVFWAKADSPTKSVKVSIGDIHSHEPNCTLVDSGDNCNLHAAAVPQSALTTTWKEFKVPFANIERTPAVDLTKAFALHFGLDPATADTTGTVDFWIDDVEFYREP